MSDHGDDLTKWREKQLAAGVTVDKLFGTIAAELIILGTFRGMTFEESIQKLTEFVALTRQQQNKERN